MGTKCKVLTEWLRSASGYNLELSCCEVSVLTTARHDTIYPIMLFFSYTMQTAKVDFIFSGGYGPLTSVGTCCRCFIRQLYPVLFMLWCAGAAGLWRQVQLKKKKIRKASCVFEKELAPWRRCLVDIMDKVFHALNSTVNRLQRHFLWEAEAIVVPHRIWQEAIALNYY